MSEGSGLSFRGIAWLAIFGVAGFAAWRVLGEPQGIEAKARVSKDRMRKIYQAVALYREDNGSTPERGDFREMRLPPFGYVASSRLGLQTTDWLCACVSEASGPSELVTRRFTYWNDDDPKQTFDADSMLLSSLACNEDLSTLGAPLVSHRGIGVRLSGEFVDLRRPGNVTDPHWWEKRKP